MRRNPSPWRLRWALPTQLLTVGSWEGAGGRRREFWVAHQKTDS